MDPATLIALLAGGAIAKLDKLGGQAVMDAYAGLKRVLIDTYKFATADTLETKPKDEATIKQAEQDLPPEAAQDAEVERKAQELEAALATIPPERWQQAGVLIEGLTARRTIEMGKVNAGRRGVTIRRVRAEEGDIKLGDITG